MHKLRIMHIKYQKDFDGQSNRTNGFSIVIWFIGIRSEGRLSYTVYPYVDIVRTLRFL